MTDTTHVPTHETIAHFYDELFNKQNHQMLERYVAEDYVYKNPFQDTVGRQQIIDLMDVQRVAFDNYHLRVDEVAIDREIPSVAICWTMTGIFVRSFFGYSPTGKPFHFRGITMMLWRDGQAVAGWGHSDIHEQLRTSA
jgi:hypothetical protein